MTLPTLIRAHQNRLVREWAEYAGERITAAEKLPARELENSARNLFRAIAADMELSQTAAEQFQKAVGEKPFDRSPIAAHATHHADDRLGQGFTINDIASQFRAARASVMRLWASEVYAVDVEHDEIIRFNEAIDEAVSISLKRFDDQLNRSRELFLGVLGHDIRNPLGAIMLSSRVLLKDDHLAPASSKASARIFSSGSRLTRMIDDLLDFTRTRLGRSLPVSLAEGDMGAAVADVVDELRAYHPAARIRYETSGNLHGRWDFGRLAQVVSNLGGNAIQHGDQADPSQSDSQVLLITSN